MKQAGREVRAHFVEAAQRIVLLGNLHLHIVQLGIPGAVG